ncbi:MAG: hypothetical protein KME31_33770 [Tolypothrix carrinoi HA7290-LM1]|jgi:hypothetical protein|nr:hypothetical protein [Tolypothrix carrinoi HA7290-LM1]
MSRHKIFTNLAPDQEAMIPIYREKWHSIAISKEPINREKVTEVIKAAYFISNYPEPEILFYSNPFVAIQDVTRIENCRHYLGRNINIKFLKIVVVHIQCGLKQQLDEHLFIRLRNQIQFPVFPYYSTQEYHQISYFPYGIERCIEQQLLTDFEKHNPELEFSDISYFTGNLTRAAGWAIWGCMFDFCILVLELHHDRNKWHVFQQLIQYCGLLFRYEKVCIACDRPWKLFFDEENRLHADGKPALEFADGYSVYANHGQCISEES